MAKSEAGNSDQLLDENDRWSNPDDWQEKEIDCLCPFCPATQPVPETFQHCKTVHDFDFYGYKKRFKLDFYGCMKLVNFVRKCKPTEEQVLTMEWLEGESYLAPTMEDDPLLYAFEDDESEEAVDLTVQENRVLKEQLEKLKEQFDSYKEMVQKTFMPDSVKAVVGQVKSEQSLSKYSDKGNYYYDSYAGNEIHEQMLKDTVRTEGYRDFIYNNKAYFKDKVVMDVGCGTGILSMFAAKAGAKHVYAVDNSDIIIKAQANVKENELSEKITFVRGKVEDIELPQKVDIIISEWMGYFLLFEGMLDSVLVARDKWLRQGGIMAPSKTTILLSAYGDDEWYNDHVVFWKDVYGFKMNAMNENINKNAHITVANGNELCSDEIVLADIDTKTTTSAQLDFNTDFELKINRDGKVYAFCGWFDTYFEGDGVDSVMFSTSPKTKTTHWVQTLFVLDEPLVVVQGDIVQGTFGCKKSADNARELDVKITYRHKETIKQQQFYVV